MTDGNGNITSGVLDENLNGVATSSVFQTTGTSAGTYTVAPNGQGTVTFKTTGRTYTLAIYVAETGSSSTAVIQETDPESPVTAHSVSAGRALYLASLEGNFALETSGVSAAALQVT